jgi:cytochrome c-type biogenesis protein CcmH/NrfG
VNDLTIGLMTALLATNQPAAVSNLIQDQTGLAVPVPDATEQQLEQIMLADDAALDEINSWIVTNQIPRTDTNALARLQLRIQARLDVQKRTYDSFLRNHPDHARGYLAYGSFLNDIGDEDGAKAQYDNSLHYDSKNPAVWNQLANYYGHNGMLTNAFAGYTEAIRLSPDEPVYYQNFATTVYLYRKDAREFYNINEQQVFDKALGLYQHAMKLNPTNLVFATDYAESYYGIKPYRTNDALAAWTNALKICRDENEREGVQLHLARNKIMSGFFVEAQAHLDAVTNAVFADMRRRLERSLNDHKNPTTNDVPEISTNRVHAPHAPAAK